jgi:hypothetical protein
MEKHYDLSYTELLSQFDSCRLDPEIFSHEANLRLAYINLSESESPEAQQNIQKQIKAYVVCHGAEINTTQR